MLKGLSATGWHGRIRRVTVSVVAVFAVLFIWLRVTAVDGVDRFGNVLSPDFGQFYVAGQLAASGQVTRIYEEPFFFARVNALFGQPPGADGYPFLYPPFVPWLCVPLSWMPYAVAASVYLLVSVAVMALVGRWLAREWMDDRESATDAVWLLVASLPAIRCVLYGQNGWLTLVIACVGFQLWRARRDGWCGLVFALGAFKPQLFLGLWLWLLVFGSNRARLGLVLGGIGSLVLGCAATGDGRLWLQWLHAAAQMRDSSATLGLMYSWWQAFAWRGLTDGTGAVVRVASWSLLALGWMSVLGVMAVRYRREETREASGTTAFMLALMGWVWLTPRFAQYDALILYPVLVWVWARSGKAVGRWNWERVCTICLLSSFYLGDFFSKIQIPFITVLGVAFWIMLCIESIHSSD